MDRIKQHSLLIYVLLFSISVPWYWQWMPEFGLLRFAGLPLWVLTSLLGSALISIQTVLVLTQSWSDENECAE